MALALSFLSGLLVGVVLVVAPWTPLWETNYLLQPSPMLRAALLHSVTRGVVTGLGLVNIMLALDDARTLLERTRDGA